MNRFYRIFLLLSLCAVAFGLWLVVPPTNPLTIPKGDGSEGHQKHAANALANETSPYLLQHAHNPVDWLPWGEEALQLARDSDRPIFLPIGYSSCYWCHVMEREVFMNEEIADLMNQHFVNIKVDREERPDLDEIYMTATQIITQGGGWPNSVFLTGDLKPFFTGTYFPPEDLPGRPGFPRVLESIHEAWTTRRSDVLDQAERITAIIRRLQTEPPAIDSLDITIVDGAISNLRDRFDHIHGGFGVPPKFPPDTAIDLILTRSESEADTSTLAMATATLEAIAKAGIYDHLSGGFQVCYRSRMADPSLRKNALQSGTPHSRIYQSLRGNGEPALQ